jgi:hypothetical protein
MPSGLNIDHKRQLLGSVAPYVDHILISKPGLGAQDWPSKIENDVHYPLVRSLKAAVKTALLKGDRANLLITASSFQEDGRMTADEGRTVVSIMKAGLHVTVDDAPGAIGLFAQNVVALAGQGGLSKEVLRRHNTGLSGSIGEVTVLVCGHQNRDERCGVMGPLLAKEFKSKLKHAGFNIRDDLGIPQMEVSSTEKPASVGLISHIGGHAFAGNVIIYVPQTDQYRWHPLAGKGVWYGRVEPKHVEGIVAKTVKEGVVIQELLRGVV